MSDVIATFGHIVDRLAPQRPSVSRSLLLAAYQVYGQKLRFMPDKRLPRSRQEIAYMVNRAVVAMLSHPDRAALVSVFMPCELLQALDIVPMCAEMYAAFLTGTDAETVFAQIAEEQGIPETFCSYHKVLIGSAYSGVLPSPKMIVNTSLVCDGNQLTFRELSEFYKIPQYYVDVPLWQDEESVRYVTSQLKELAVFLQDVTGQTIDERRLKEAVGRSKETIDLLRVAEREKARHALTCDVTSELYEIYMAHNALGTENALRYARDLVSDLKAAPPYDGLRLLWLHTIPHWQKPVTDMFNFSPRAQVICCDMNHESLIDLDPEKPYESMARRLVYSRWNGGQQRVDLALELARELHADGVVCFCHWGCKQTMGLSGTLKSALDVAGFPTLILNGDGCDRRNASDGQTQTRLEAFIEMLENRHG